MDTNGNKSSSEIPSALEMTIMRPSSTGALVPASLVASAAPPPLGPPPGLAQAPTMPSMMQALRRRWLLAVSAATLGAGLTVAAVFFLMPPRFLAEARLLVAARTDPGLSLGNREDTDFVIVKANLPSLLKSPLNLSSALNQPLGPTKFIRDLSIVRDREGDAVAWLEKAIKTDYNLGPEILRVTLSADRGDEAADLLNAVVNTFLSDLEHKEKVRADDMIKQLQKKRGELEQELTTYRRDLGQREKALNLPNLVEQAKKLEIAMATLSAIQKEHIKNKLDIVSTTEELRSLRETQRDIDKVEAPDEQLNAFLKESSRGQALHLELLKAEKEVNDAERAGVSAGSSAPYRQNRDRLKQKIAELREELRPELESTWRTKFAQDLKLAERATSDRLKTLGKQKDELDGLVHTAREEVQRYTPGNSSIPIEILSLRDTVDSTMKGIGKVAEDIIVLRANAAKTRVSLLQRASEPRAKDISRQLKFAGAGGLGMFGLLLVGVTFLEFRSRKIGNAEDVAHGLGMTVLGTVPPLPKQARKPLPNGTAQCDVYWQSRLMEAIDGIRTILLHTARNDSLRAIMVTSAVGGEGKTSLASQLAASLARAWKRTLLIDGDLRNPATHRLFNVPLDPGLSEVLRGEAEAVHAIRATSIGRLWVLPAGHWDAHAVQALAQDHVRTLFQTLKQQYDFIIIDSCPVLPVTDSLLLGQHADGVLFSVMRDVSRMPAVYAAQQRLQNLGIRTLGAVVIGDQGDDLGARNYKYASAYSGK
jgi:succinoglycan biosynthesis transport protein ExoP